MVIGKGILFLLLILYMCSGDKNYSPSFFCDVDGPEQLEWTLKLELCLEEDFFGSPTVTKTSYYFLPVLPLGKSCCRGI